MLRRSSGGRPRSAPMSSTVFTTAGRADRHAHRLRDVVSHQQSCLALLANDTPDVRRYRKARLIVQRGKRLIQQQDLRIRGQCPDQRTALPHAAGQLAGPLSRKARQLVAVQPLPHVVIGGAPSLALHRQTQRYVVPHALPLKQLIPLGHEPHAAGGARHRLARHVDGTAGQRLQPGDSAQQRGLAAAGGPHQTDELPLRHVKGYVAYRLHLPVGSLIAGGSMTEMYAHKTCDLLSQKIRREPLRSHSMPCAAAGEKIFREIQIPR